jgi:hypothetical protein
MTHIKRRHNGIGNPIHLQYNRSARSKIDYFEDSSTLDGQHPHILTEPNSTQFNQKPDFIDHFHHFIFNQLPARMKKFGEIYAYLSLVDGSRRSDVKSQLGSESYFYAPSQVISAHRPASQTSVFGLEAIMCSKCFFPDSSNVIIVNNTGGIGGKSLVKSPHVCRPEDRMSDKQLKELEQIGEQIGSMWKNNGIPSLSEFYATFLKDKCHEWIKKEVKLVSVKLLEWSKQSNKSLSELTIAENHWAVRAVRDSYTDMNEDEMLEFLKMCKGRTFGVFEVSPENTISGSNNYLFYLHWLPLPPPQIERMIANYF